MEVFSLILLSDCLNMDLFVTICNCFLVLFGLLGGDFPDSGHRTDPGSAPDFRFSEPITGAVPCLSPLYIRCEPRNGRTAYELLPGIWIIKIFVLYLPLMKLRRLHTTHGEGHGIFGVRTGCGVAPHCVTIASATFTATTTTTPVGVE